MKFGGGGALCALYFYVAAPQVDDDDEVYTQTQRKSPQGRAKLHPAPLQTLSEGFWDVPGAVAGPYPNADGL